MSSELQSVTQKLHQLLGSEDSAAKQQLVLWSSIGHPIPPRSQVVIQFLPELIEMSHHLPKVDTDHMTAVRRKILDLFLLLKNIPIDQNCKFASLFSVFIKMSFSPNPFIGNVILKNTYQNIKE